MSAPLCLLPLWKKTLKNTVVILRVDYNSVNITNTTGLRRITETLPTINFLLLYGATIVLITHQGRPKRPSQKLSTKKYVSWFIQQGYTALFAANLEQVQTALKNNVKGIIILENIRFFPEETACSLAFAQQLKNLGDYFVQDAFATLHRNETSITLLPTLFEPHRRSIGFLVEKEITMLNIFIQRTAQPFVMLQGGNKIATKLPILEEFLPRIETLLLSTPLCFSFLKILDQSLGVSSYELSTEQTAQHILNKAHKKNVAVILPQDFIVAQGTLQHPEAVEVTKKVKDNQIILAPGPETIDLFCKKISQAKTIFINGLPGLLHCKSTLSSTKKLLESIAQSSAYTLIAGGDTLALVEALGFEKLKHLSTGGGATLTYLSKQTLVGLLPFVR